MVTSASEVHLALRSKAAIGRRIAAVEVIGASWVRVDEGVVMCWCNLVYNQ